MREFRKDNIMNKTKPNTIAIALLIAVTVICGPVFGAKDDSVERLRQTGDAFATVAQNAVEAVVAIKVETTVSVNASPFEDEFFERFFGRQFRIPEQKRKRQGQGSGFIIDKHGYILTNNHVVGDADKITVILHDGREFEAKLIGADDKTDVAVVKVEGDDLPVMTMGDSDKLRIGEWAIAVGNPFGLEATVTTGVISATGRQVSITEDGYADFIQTDAAINPGNSGGPLLNIDGEAIGINTFILSQSGGYMGIGFAIPINMAKNIKDQLIETGTVTRGFLGLIPNDVTPEIAKYYKIDEAKGVIISNISKDSAAEKAGLKDDDIVLQVNGEEIKNAMDFRNTIAFMSPGTKITMKILRDHKEMEVTAVLGTKPEGGNTSEFARKLGLEVEEITDDLADKLSTAKGRGVAVSKVTSGSVAEEKGLKPGMVILSVNRYEVNSVDDFNEAIEKEAERNMALLRIKQGRFSVRVVLSLDEE